MQKLTWLESHFPNGKLESGIDKANELYWSISVEKIKNGWRVLGGDKVIFWADNEESIEAFLYGLALAYCAIPETSFEKLKNHLKELVE
jgi:hypothetical protein